MSRARLAAVLAAALATVLAGCAKDRADVVQPKPLPQTANCPTPPESTAAATPALDGAAAVTPPTPTFHGQLLLPPEKPGESRTELSGCLAGGGTEADGSRYPPPPVSRSAPVAPKVRINSLAKGVIISHDLDHACCLKADVTTRLEAGRLTVLEKLSGTPCRCMCASTIRTAVGLAPGRYTLAIQVDEGSGPPKTVAEQPFTVEGVAP